MSGTEPIAPTLGASQHVVMKDRERIEEEVRKEEKIDLADHNDLPLKRDGLAEKQMKSESDNYTITQTIRIFWKPVLICSIAAFSAATDGYQGKMNSNILANKGFIAQFAPAGASKLDKTHVATWGGIASLGQVLGQAAARFPNDYLGRRGGMFVCMLLLVISVTVEYTSKQWWHYTIAKLIAGWGVGAVQATLPLFISEHAPPQVRGTVIVCYSLWYSIGQLMSSVTLQVNKETSPMDWQTPILTQYGMVGLSTVIFLLLPETPWWLVSKNKLEKARKAMRWINKSVPGYDADHEIGIMQATLEKQKEANLIAAQAGRWAVLKGLNMKRFLIASWPKVLQQFVGLAIFSNYSAYFFDLAGNKNPFMVTIILTCAQIVAVFFDAALVDRLGRRIMTIVGFGGACFGVLLIAIVGCFNYASPQLGALLVFGGTAANFFNSFQSSTSYAYLTELSEQRLRATTAAFGLAYCNIYAVILNFIVPLMLDAWEVRAAWFFVCTGIPGTVLAYFIMPESARRSAAEIQEMFVDRVPLRKWKGHKTAVERDLEIRMGQVAA